MKKLYTATCNIEGGREGTAKSSDGNLAVSLTPPKELGGSGNATNPEQLFAAGYGACFESAVRHVAKLKKISVQRSMVHSQVNLFSRDDGSFSLGVTLKVSLPELERTVAQDLVTEAHRVCPYSNATRGNIDVNIVVE